MVYQINYPYVLHYVQLREGLVMCVGLHVLSLIVSVNQICCYCMLTVELNACMIRTLLLIIYRDYRWLCIHQGVVDSGAESVDEGKQAGSRRDA